MLDFQVSVDRTAGCRVVTVAGELDVATAPQLASALAEAASAGGDDAFVVNLLPTTFIDSTGLTTLFRAHKEHADGPGGFAIVCGPDNLEVWRVIDLMGFNEVFVIHSSLAAAGCGDVSQVS